MAPRVLPRPRSSLEEYRVDEDYAPLESRAFWRYATMPVPPGRDARAFLDEAESRVLNKTTTTLGGFLVPQDLNESIISAARARSAIAQVSLELPTDSGETLLVPTATAHGTAAWLAESAAYTDAPETFGQPSLSAFKATSWVLATEELIRDSGVPLDAYMLELGGRLGDLEDAAFSVGTGTGQPQGVVHSSSPFGVTVAAVGSTLKYTPADLLAAFKALAPAYRVNASWIFAADDLATLQGLVDSAGAFALPSLQSAEPTLFGRPVYIGPNLPAPGVSAKSAIVGDFSRGYVIRRVRGVTVERLNELKADVGQVVYRARERVDGRCALAAACQILQHSAT